MPTAIAFPSFSRGQAPSAMSFGLQKNLGTFASPATGMVRTRSRLGWRWMASLRYDNLQSADVALMEALIARLEGTDTVVAMPVFKRPNPVGTIGGTVLVNGADQTGNSIICNGATAASVAKAGTYLSIGSELKIVTEDCTADGSGNITLVVNPPMRDSPANGATVNYSAPTVDMMLSETLVPATVTMPLFGSYQLDLMEVW